MSMFVYLTTALENSIHKLYGRPSVGLRRESIRYDWVGVCDVRTLVMRGVEQ